jgi:hypothetical protein
VTSFNLELIRGYRFREIDIFRTLCQVSVITDGFFPKTTKYQIALKQTLHITMYIESTFVFNTFIKRADPLITIIPSNITFLIDDIYIWENSIINM